MAEAELDSWTVMRLTAYGHEVHESLELYLEVSLEKILVNLYGILNVNPWKTDGKITE